MELRSRKRVKSEKPRTTMDLPPVLDDGEEFTLERREASPAHCLTKIKSFSMLSKHGFSEVESLEFEAGDYKWKLVIYPDGDEKAKESDHISVYLCMVETRWEVNGMCNLFLYNHISDNYLCFRGKTRRFNAINFNWGISKFMAKNCFTDPSNGYLFYDKCVFGAEVFVIKNRGVIGDISLLAAAPTNEYKHEWVIPQFHPRLHDSGVRIFESPKFDAQGFKWYQFYDPNPITFT